MQTQKPINIIIYVTACNWICVTLKKANIPEKYGQKNKQISSSAINVQFNKQEVVLLQK